MKVETIYHTGFVVSDIERSIEFYRDVLGMRIEREPTVASGDWLARLVGYDRVRIVIAFAGPGDGHSIELLEYREPRGDARPDQFERHNPGAAHAGMIVDDVKGWRAKLEALGVTCLGPAEERDLPFPWARRAIYFQDPDGNWLEMVQRDPRPPGSTEN